MRTLVVGAGAVGGYFGGRLLEAGHDVTFLVRPKRAEQIAASGLVISSSFGDIITKASTLLSEQITAPFDVIILSCKAYDLESAMLSFSAAVGENTVILPLLNGMQHLERLDRRFGAEKVLGGLCQIAVTVDPLGVIVHLNTNHSLVFGERDGTSSGRIEMIAEMMASTHFDSRISNAIELEMWEKWVFLATLASATCLMRASVGDIAQSGGSDLVLAILEECRMIAEFAGFTPRPQFMGRFRSVLTDKDSTLTASMLRDVERGGPTEADHILGDLIRRAPSGQDIALLQLAYAQLRACDVRRLRLQGGAA